MLKARLGLLLLAGMLLLILPCTALAAGFAKIGAIPFRAESYFTGARTIALGSADVATATGPLAILQNPAVRREGQSLQFGYENSEWSYNYDVTNWALSGEWNRFRLGVVRHQSASWDNEIRTAYNLEGTGETFDLVQRVWAVGLSAEILPGKWQERGFSVVAGANWRHYYEQNWTDGKTTSDADLGLTVSWRQGLSDGWVSLNAATMRHNISENTIIWEIEDRDPLELILPYYTQTGFTVIRAWDLPDQSGEAIRLLVAYSHRNETRDEDRETYHADRWGIELTAVEMVSFRWGDSDDSTYNNVPETMGIGLTIPRKYIAPVEVQFEWTRFDAGWLGSWQDIYGFTAGVKF